MTMLSMAALAITIQAAQLPVSVPRDAATAILDAFAHYDVVGMNAAHSDKTQDEFILALIRQPRFATTVDDIVVECGNRRFQPTLDRFIAGEDVPLESVRPVWRETTVLMCGLSGFCESLFATVRDVNRSLQSNRKPRVLAGEPPVDWSAGGNPHGADRDASISDVMVGEVLSKHRKALMLFGVGHLIHGFNSAVARYESRYAGKTFVIDTHHGFAAFFDLERGHQLEARMRDWPVPSLIRLTGSWLADLDLPYFLWPFPKRIGCVSVRRLSGFLWIRPRTASTFKPRTCRRWRSTATSTASS